MEDLYEVPPCDTHGYFFDSLGRTAHKPNTLADSKSQPDESAVFSVLQFGAIIPPLSPWRGIRRFMPGYQYRGTELVGPLKLECPPHVANLDFEQQSDEIERLLDRDLGEDDRKPTRSRAVIQRRSRFRTHCQPPCCTWVS